MVYPINPSRSEIQGHPSYASLAALPEVPDLALLQWWTQIFEIPCVAIGGITPDNCGPLVAAGADFLAVSGAVWNGDEVAVVEAFAEAIKAATIERKRILASRR